MPPPLPGKDKRHRSRTTYLYQGRLPPERLLYKLNTADLIPTYCVYHADRTRDVVRHRQRSAPRRQAGPSSAAALRLRVRPLCALCPRRRALSSTFSIMLTRFGTSWCKRHPRGKYRRLYRRCWGRRGEYASGSPGCNRPRWIAAFLCRAYLPTRRACPWRFTGAWTAVVLSLCCVGVSLRFRSAGTAAEWASW